MFLFVHTPIPLDAPPKDDGMYPNLASWERPAFVLFSFCTPSKYVTGLGSTPLYS